MIENIFVGGTGRSGTTLITNILGNHKKIYSFPKESRFIIDPDGIKDIISNFSLSYNTNRADVALFRFKRLMLDYLTNPNNYPYYGYDFYKIFGKKFYYQTVLEFTHELYYNYFEGNSNTVKSKNKKGPRVLFKKQTKINRIYNFTVKNMFDYYNSIFQKEKIYITKKFNEGEIIEKCSTFINKLFMKVKKENGKMIWCEKTPGNILDIELLFKLFPKTKFIHMKRDPREIVCSLITRKWAPNNIKDSCFFLKGTLQRIQEIKAEFIPPENSYIEIKLEDLAINTTKTMQRLFSFLGIKYDLDEEINIDKKRVDYWREKLTNKEIKTCEKILRDLIIKYGYDYI